MAGLLPGSPGQKFVAQVLRVFSIFWLLLGPNSGPVFGPKNGSSNLALNKKRIVGVKLGPKNGSQKRPHFWDLEITFFCIFSVWLVPFLLLAASSNHACSWLEWLLGPGEKQALMTSMDVTRTLLKYGSNRNHHPHVSFCAGRGHSPMQGP